MVGTAPAESQGGIRDTRASVKRARVPIRVMSGRKKWMCAAGARTKSIGCFTDREVCETSGRVRLTDREVCETSGRVRLADSPVSKTSDRISLPDRGANLTLDRMNLPT